MVEESVFRGVIVFFDRLGIYDVVLPFLLVFTMVFAILEKTKVFGTEPFQDGEITKKNLNAMTAFVTAFLVIASTQAVKIISGMLQWVFLVLLILVCFLLLIGTFFGKDEVKLEGNWRTFMMALVFLAVVLIFAAVVPVNDNESALEWAYNKVVNNYDSTAVAAIILGIGLIGIMFFIVRDPKPEAD